MKKVSLILSALLISMSSMAQMYLWQGGRYTFANLDSITFSANAKYDNTFTIAPSMMGLQVGNTAQLKLVDNTLPASAYQWKSSNRSVATVDTQGVVTAKASGMAIISATSCWSEQTCILTVYGAVNVEVFRAYPSEYTVKIGETFMVGCEVEPEIVQAGIVWTSSNETVATVDIMGMVTPLGVGSTTITATLNGTDISSSCTIHVVDIQGIEIPSSLDMFVGETPKLTYTIVPQGISANVLWSSSNTEVVTVNEDGVVTALNFGTALITATVEGKNLSSTCQVTVSNEAVLKNYVFADYGLFGDVEYIPNTKRWIPRTNGDSLLCQLGYVTFICWSDGLYFISGKGFSGNGIIIEAKMPIYWVVEGEHASMYLGSASGFHIDTCSSVKPYTAKAGELADLQKYGDYFTQLIEYRKDTNNKLDNDLYYDSQIGTQLFGLKADDGIQTYNYGNVKKAQFFKDRDEYGNNLLQYTAEIEWYDFVNEDRYLGLKATYDANRNLENIIKPYNMRYIKMEYTNIIEGTGNTAPRKVKTQTSNESLYMLGDKSRLHLGENPFPANAKRIVKK